MSKCPLRPVYHEQVPLLVYVLYVGLCRQQSGWASELHCNNRETFKIILQFTKEYESPLPYNMDATNKR